MRTALPTAGRTPALARDKAPPAVDASRGILGTRGSSERPGSLREALIRWLNEEL